MRRVTSRNLYLIGLVLSILGGILIAIGIATGSYVTGQGGAISGSPNVVWLGIGGTLAVVGGLLALVAWVGAIIRMIQLKQWIWLILLLVASGVTMLVYIFVGPQTMAREEREQSNIRS